MARNSWVPSFRWRAARGQLVCLVRTGLKPYHREGVRVLAFVASPRAPFLRRFTLYRCTAPAPASPDGTPPAAAA